MRDATRWFADIDATIDDCANKTGRSCTADAACAALPKAYGEAGHACIFPGPGHAIIAGRVYEVPEALTYVLLADVAVKP